MLGIMKLAGASAATKTNRVVDSEAQIDHVPVSIATDNVVQGVRPWLSTEGALNDRFMEPVRGGPGICESFNHAHNSIGFSFVSLEPIGVDEICSNMNE